MTEMLDPIRGQCIGMVAGNHGRRTTARAGLDPDRRIAKDLGVLDSYSTDFLAKTFVLYDPVGRHRTFWNVVAHHTTGGGSSLGGKLNALHKLSNSYLGFDLYLGAHSHSTVAGTLYPNAPHNNARGSRTIKVRQHFSSCGSMLFYDGSYAAAKAMPPADPSQVLHLLATKTQHRKNAQAPDGWLKPYDRRVVPL